MMMSKETMESSTPASSSMQNKTISVPVSDSSMTIDRSSINNINDPIIHSHTLPPHPLYPPSLPSTIPNNSSFSAAPIGSYGGGPLVYHNNATPAIILPHNPSIASISSSINAAAAAPFTPSMMMQIPESFNSASHAVASNAPYSSPLFPPQFNINNAGPIASSDHGELLHFPLIPQSLNPLAVFSARTLQLYRQKEKDEIKRDKKKQAELNLLLSEEGKEFISELCRLYAALVDIPFRNALLAYDQQQKQIAIEASIPHYKHTAINRPAESVFVANYVDYCRRLSLFSSLTVEAVEKAIERVIECVPYRQFSVIYNLAKKYGVKTVHEEQWYYEKEDNKGNNRRMTLLRTRLRATIHSYFMRDPHIVHQFFNEIDQIMKAFILIENSANVCQQPTDSMQSSSSHVAASMTSSSQQQQNVDASVMDHGPVSTGNEGVSVKSSEADRTERKEGEKEAWNRELSGSMM